MKSNLFQSLQEDLSLVLLFLNNVKKIRIEVISESGSVKLAEVHRTVEDLFDGLKRIQITDDMKTEVFLASEVTTADLPDPDERRKLSQLSDKLKVRSQVMVAAPELLADNLEGRVAVMLPLPKSQTTNTNLPVVVNGFFAIGENRRVLKLETSDDHSDEVSATLLSSYSWLRLTIIMSGEVELLPALQPGAPVLRQTPLTAPADPGCLSCRPTAVLAAPHLALPLPRLDQLCQHHDLTGPGPALPLGHHGECRNTSTTEGPTLDPDGQITAQYLDRLHQVSRGGSQLGGSRQHSASPPEPGLWWRRHFCSEHRHLVQRKPGGRG